MVRIDIDDQGNLRTRARHAPSGAELITDAPRDNQGEGRSFSPTDLVATGLGSCMLTIMGIVARRHDWDLTGTRVRVEKTMTDAPRRIGALAVHIELPRGLPAEARERLERAALTCPVHGSLHPDVRVSLELHETADA